MTDEPLPQEVYPLEQELNMLAPERVRFTRDAFDDLVLRLDGETTAGVRLVRSFPRSAAGRMLAVRAPAGEEIGIIADVRALDDNSRRVAEQELDRLYFIPRITRVLDVEERFHVPIWQVETDRGPRSFEIRSGRRDVLVLGSRILIRDADGNHYEIPDYRRLDGPSQALIESQI